MLNSIKLKKYNGKIIDISDETTRYFLSMKDKVFQASWMSEFPVFSGHDKQFISFEFDSIKDSTFYVYFADNKEFNNPFIIETKDRYIDNVGIFIPGIKYYWKVVDKNTNEESDTDSFEILNSPVRWINAGSVFNVRDLGGWETIDNKRVKYGFIYRGGQLKLDNQWEKSYMDEYSYKVFDYLKIKTEVELRGGFDHKLSQIHDDTNNIYINGIGYEQILSMSEEQKEQYRVLFKNLSDESFYPLYFHCSWGADRTGVLAFLINGILGVDYDSLCEDYELTSLSGSGRRSRIDFPWKDMYPELIEKYGKDKSLKDILNEYLIDYIGVKQEEIDALRNIMLEDNTNATNTHKVTYMVDGKVYLESLVFDGYCVSSIEPGVYLDRCLDYWVNNGKKYDFNSPVHSDLILEAKFESVEYEEYDSISLKDIGLGDSYGLKEAKDFKYDGKAKTGSRMFSFNYKIEASDNNFDDGVHVEIGTLWDYKAHVWLQSLQFAYVHTDKVRLPISYQTKFEYLKTYRIDVGVLIPKNGKNKGKQVLVLKINNKIIALETVDADLSKYSIGLAGTKGILYNIEKAEDNL